jgi:hypothetical protein
MARTEEPQIDLQFSNFSLQPHGHRIDSLIDYQIEQVPPHSQSITATELQELEWHLTCASLEDPLKRPTDPVTLASSYSRQFSSSHNHHRSSSQTLDTAGKLAKPISRKQQRKGYSRLETQRNRIRSVEALAEQFKAVPSEQNSHLDISGYRPPTQALKALVETIDETAIDGDSPEDLLSAAFATYRRSRDIPAGSDWVEKPIRVRKNTSAKKRRSLI